MKTIEKIRKNITKNIAELESFNEFCVNDYGEVYDRIEKSIYDLRSVEWRLNYLLRENLV